MPWITRHGVALLLVVSVELELQSETDCLLLKLDELFVRHDVELIASPMVPPKTPSVVVAMTVVDYGFVLHRVCVPQAGIEPALTNARSCTVSRRVSVSYEDCGERVS